MKQTRLIMGMPITVEITSDKTVSEAIALVFAFFIQVDKQFSPYKKTSEVSRINAGLIRQELYSSEMQEVLALAEKTKQETDGYFDVYHEGRFDPSGIVKGWAIQKASEMLREMGYTDFYIDAGGDIQVSGKKDNRPWRVGIRNPFNRFQIVKALQIGTEGVATSGTAIRGEHIYNPKGQVQRELVSLTVIGPTILDADRVATAAFAMGKQGMYFLEKLPEYEAYGIDTSGKATYTSGFERFVV